MIITNKINKNKNLLLNKLKSMRKFENCWQPGKILYKEGKSKILINFNGKTSNQIFLTKDLFNNNLAFYDPKLKKLIFSNSLNFWCNQTEQDLQLNQNIYNLISSKTKFRELYLLKKKVLFFFKLKSRSKLVSQKLIKNINKITNENLKLNFTKFKYSNNLFNFLLKKQILIRTYKIYAIQSKFKLILFIFLIKCNISRNYNKKKIKFLFFSNKSFFIPISQIGPREQTLIKAQKRMLLYTERLNYYYFLTNMLDKNSYSQNILSKKKLYQNNNLYNKYFNDWYFLQHHFNKIIKLKKN